MRDLFPSPRERSFHHCDHRLGDFFVSFFFRNITTSSVDRFRHVLKFFFCEFEDVVDFWSRNNAKFFDGTLLAAFLVSLVFALLALFRARSSPAS